MTGDQVKRVTVEEARANVWCELRHHALCWYRLGKEEHEVTEDECSCGLREELDDLVAAVREDERERMGYMIRHTVTGEPEGQP